MAMFDVVFFDVDGTLLDSAQGIFDTMRHTFAAMETDISGVDLQRFVGPPLRVTFGSFYKEPQRVEQAVAIYREWYRDHGSHQSPPYPGVPQMLGRLWQAGVILCTATSKPVEVVTPILEEQGLAHLFYKIGGASMDASIDTKEAVIRDLVRLPAFCGKRILMVGDRRDDLLGAAACGLEAAGVLYGYGSYAELQACPYKALLANVTELEKYIMTGE